jgi:hypothetical protein
LIYKNRVAYKSEILSGTDGPIFKVVPQDDPQSEFIANSATGAWSPIIKKVQEAKMQLNLPSRNLTTVSGPGE